MVRSPNRGWPNLLHPTPWWRITRSVVLVLMTGFAYPTAVAHSVHHAHHTADTHSTVLCFWVCTASQMATPPSLFLPTPDEWVAPAIFQALGFHQSSEGLLRPARGPPHRP